MTDYSHLNALEYRLHNETIRLNNAKTESERSFRASVVSGVEKEIAGEKKFLGIYIKPSDISAPDMSDAELLAMLEA